MATKKNKNFVRDLYNTSSRFITLLSKSNRIEPNLFRKGNKKANPVKDIMGKLKDNTYRVIDDKIISLFRKTTKKEKSLDTKVEAVALGAKGKHEGSGLVTKEKSEGYNSIGIGYTTTLGAIPSERKSAFNKLYGSSADYSEDNKIVNAIRRIKEGPVKITAGKLNIGSYTFAVLNPQWNMPTLSKFDYDTLSPAITNTTSIDKENIKYDPGYIALRYRFLHKPRRQTVGYKK